MANRNLSRVILLGGLSVNLNHLKKAKQKCPKWPIVNCHALCYIGGLSVNLNHLKSGTQLSTACSTPLSVLDWATNCP